MSQFEARRGGRIAVATRKENGARRGSAGCCSMLWRSELTSRWFTAGGGVAVAMWKNGGAGYRVMEKAADAPQSGAVVKKMAGGEEGREEKRDVGWLA